MYDIGIDLGTTYSVIAVKGEVKLADGYPPGVFLPECDVTIIPTPDGDSTFPSVFWMDPSDPTSVLVGMEAKSKAHEGEAPIMFSKRSIGTDEPLRIRDRVFTAKEVATYVLKHLKACTERALGQPVRRAVVTPPAYFDRNQVQETREAAEAAGFDMSLPEQLLMEPSAAALAYTKGIEKDPLRIMTYDLGGGTFDVTVLERSQGVITIKSFDGNHLLGGYNFDRALVQWILERLKEKGRIIPYDDNNTEDRSRRARLLQLAESVKIKLTEQRSPKVPVDVRAPDILVDAQGRQVPVLERINREQYAELIKDELEKTITCSQSALAKAGISVGELDALLLVGGSTYGQWVQEAVKKAFGIAGQLYNPDLCVAAGAALRAADLPAIASGQGIEIVLEVPASSALPKINVAGSLRSPDGALSPADLAMVKVFLSTPAAGTLETSLGTDGRFIFEEIALQEDGSSDFSIEITDANGLSRLTKPFSVNYAPEGAAVTEIYTVLPKPIYIRTKDGMKPLAEEGALLPAKCEIARKRLHEESTLDIEVFQGDELISTIEIQGIASDAGVGSEVVLTVEITEKNEMKGTVTVKSRTGVVAAQRPIQIKFPPMKLPDLADLRAQSDDLEAKREQLEALSDDPEQRLRLAGRGRKLSSKLQRLFAEQAPDKQEIHAALKEMNALVNPPAEDMNPPRAQFRQLIEHSQDLLDSKGTDPQVEPLRPLLKRIETEGNDAYTTKNHKKWGLSNDNLAKLHARIQKICDTDTDKKEEQTPDTVTLKDQARQQVDQLRTYVQNKHEDLRNLPRYPTRIRARLDGLESMLTQMDKAIEKVADGADPKQAMAQLRQAIRPCAEVRKRADEADKEI